MNLSGRRFAILSVAVSLLSLAAVVGTIEDIGITTDEPHYYDSCLKEMEWFALAWDSITSGDWTTPFSRETIDRYWHFQVVFNVHPPFYKLASCLTLALFRDLLGSVAAYRLSPAIMFSILAGLLFWTTGRRYGPTAGLWAAAGFVTMPRLFAHAHCGATDMPLSFLWFASALAFHQALESKKWSVVFAAVYGLALATKFSALIIPLPLVIFVIASRKFKQAAWPVGISLVVSPLILVGLNPEWWIDTFQRVSAFVLKSASRSEYLHIPTYYLGKKYEFVLPWHHSLVYTLFTVQPLVLSGFIYGVYRILRRPSDDPWAGHLLIHWAVLHGVMILPSSPGHDGVRLFLPSFAFLAAVSAKGFQHFVTEALPGKILPALGTLGRKANPAGLAGPVLAGLMVVTSLFALVKVHPFELSYYNNLTGGIRGASALGMETTYWWDAFNRETCAKINRYIPPSSVIFARNYWHFGFLQRIGWLDPTYKFRNRDVNYILQYHRQGILGPQDWLLIRKAQVGETIELEGVRLVSIYKHPEAVYDLLDKLSRSQDREALYEMSMLLRVVDERQKAIICLEEYIRGGLDNTEAVLDLAVYYLEEQRPEEAAAVLKKIEKEGSGLLRWRTLMAEANEKLGNYPAAIAYLNKNLEETKLDLGSLRWLGMIYYRMNKIEEAAGYFKLVLEVDPYDETGLQMLGWIRQKEGNVEAALDCYYRWLDQKPDEVSVMINAGGLEMTTGRTAVADSLFHRVLELDKGNLNACQSLAALFAKAGEPDSVVKYMQLAALANPQLKEKILNEYLPSLLGDINRPAAGPSAPPAP